MPNQVSCFVSFRSGRRKEVSFSPGTVGGKGTKESPQLGQVNGSLLGSSRQYLIPPYHPPVAHAAASETVSGVQKHGY